MHHGAAVSSLTLQPTLLRCRGPTHAKKAGAVCCGGLGLDSAPLALCLPASCLPCTCCRQPSQGPCKGHSVQFQTVTDGLGHAIRYSFIFELQSYAALGGLELVTWPKLALNL